MDNKGVSPYILDALVKVAPHHLSLTVLTRKQIMNELRPRTPGLYLLLCEADNGYEVFYVGRTNNLRKRLLEHIHRNESNPCIKRHLRDYKCYYHTIELRSIQFLPTFESELIRTYQPPCNLK